MISADEVFRIFLTLISPDSVEGTDRLLSLCRSSLEKLLKRLKSDADLGDPRIPYAAACDVYYVYVLSTMTDIEENTDFRTGDLSVSRKIKETLEVAEKIRDDGLEAVRELLDDNSFGVWSV